jgi:hypothetical protein
MLLFGCTSQRKLYGLRVSSKLFSITRPASRALVMFHNVRWRACDRLSDLECAWLTLCMRAKMRLCSR